MVRTAHSTSEGHTSVCCWRKGGCGRGSDGIEKEQKIAALDAGRGEKRAPRRTAPSRINSVKSGQGLSQRGGGDEPQRLRQPASTQRCEAAALCVPCNQEVTEMGAALSEAPSNISIRGCQKRVWFLVAAASAGRSAMMSAAHTGTFLNKGKSVWLGW